MVDRQYNRKEWDYPVLESEGEVAITDRDKTEMMVKAFFQGHGSGNLTEDGRRRRAMTKRQHLAALERSRVMEDQPLNYPFRLERN